MDPMEPLRIEVTKIGKAVYTGRSGAEEEQWCRNWHLTTKQAQHFFQLSKAYDYNPYSAFYQVSCSISGELESDGAQWKFEIEGGGVATWTRGSKTKYWGCGDKRCEPLVIILTDFMSGE